MVKRSDVVVHFGHGYYATADSDPEELAEWMHQHAVAVPLSGVPAFVKAVVYDYGSEHVGSTVLVLKGC